MNLIVIAVLAVLLIALAYGIVIARPGMRVVLLSVLLIVGAFCMVSAYQLGRYVGNVVMAQHHNFFVRLAEKLETDLVAGKQEEVAKCLARFSKECPPSSKPDECCAFIGELITGRTNSEPSVPYAGQAGSGER